MPSRNVYHVVPSEDRWGVRLEGSPTLSYETDSQSDAVDRAASYIRQLGAGRVVVHAETGQIETVHTFDQLPAPEPSLRELALSRPALIGVAAIALIAFGYGLSRR